MTGNIQRLQLSYPLLHLLLHGLIRAHDRLLVDDYFRRVGAGSADARSDGRGICVYDNSEECNFELVSQRKEKKSTYPSSIVSSKHNSTKSKFSSTPLFSNEFRRSMVSASVRDVSAAEIIKSFSVGPAMK